MRALHSKRTHQGTENMAQWVRELAVQESGPEFRSRTPHQMFRVAWHTNDPCTVGTEDRRMAGAY